MHKIHENNSKNSRYESTSPGKTARFRRHALLSRTMRTIDYPSICAPKSSFIPLHAQNPSFLAESWWWKELQCKICLNFLWPKWFCLQILLICCSDLQWWVAMIDLMLLDQNLTNYAEKIILELIEDGRPCLVEKKMSSLLRFL